MDDEELRVAQDHTDDLTHERVFEIFVGDLRARGERVSLPSDPFTDKAFIRLLNRVYDLGTPSMVPPEHDEERAVDAA
jgi:hypothetical protein